LYKLIVLTDPDNADGFRLAGVDVEVVDSDDKVRERLNRLLDDESSGIIAVNEHMIDRKSTRLNSSHRL